MQGRNFRADQVAGAEEARNLESRLRSLSLDKRESSSTRLRASWLWLAICVLAVAVLLPVLAFRQSEAPAEAATSLEKAAAPLLPVTQPQLFASGYVAAQVEATVAAEITGRVVEILVEEGQFVEKGEVTVLLDDLLLQADLEQMLLEQELILIATQTLNFELEEAQRVLAREKELLEKGYGNESVLSEARTRAAIIDSRIREKNMEGRASEARRRRLDQQIGQYQVKAPFAGVVTRRNAQVGEIISPVTGGGGFTRTGLYTIVDMSSLIVIVDINEAFIARLHPGQKAVIDLDAFPGKHFSARVKNILPVVNRERASVQVKLEFEFEEHYMKILPGMTAKVTF